MPYININGKIVEVTQQQFDDYTIANNIYPELTIAAQQLTAPAGGNITVTPTSTSTILTPNTTNTSPGQTLANNYPQVATSAPDTNYGASIQTFDDGTTLQTFDDGSVLATATDGGVTSVPSPATVDYVVNAQDAARAGLTADQLALLGAADATDPFIRARLDLPPLSEVQTLSGAIGNVNFGNIGNVVTTAIGDIKVAAGNVGNAISDFFSSSTPNTVPNSSVTTAPSTTNAGTTTQVFDDGTTLQTFDDGSVLATGTDGSLTATDAPVDNTQGYGQFTDNANVAVGSVDTTPAPTNYGASIQTFDDGTTLQTFDDGSVLATGTDGSITSSPAPTEVGTTTQVFDDGSVLTTSADGSVSATNAIEGNNLNTSSSDVQAKAREGLTAEQLTALGGADATDPYIRARLDLPPLTTQPNLVDALTPVPETVPASDVATSPADTNAGTSTQTFDDGTTLQTFDDGSVLATGTDGSVSSAPAPTDAGTTTTVNETTGAVTQTTDAGTVAVTDLPPTEVVYNAGEVNPTVDPQASLAPGESIVPPDQIDTSPAPVDNTQGYGQFTDNANINATDIATTPIDTNFGTTTQTFDDGTTLQTFDDGSVLATGTDGGITATDAPVADTQGYGQFTDNAGVSATDIATSAGDTNFGTSTQTFDDGTTLQTFDDGSVLATGTDGSITATDAPVSDTQGYGTGTTDTAGTDTTNTGTGTSADGAAASANIQGLVQGAQQQQTIADQRKQINNGDWRVRLRLAPQSKYLYNASNPGILKPLQVTDGIIFPYTPAISTNYRATYSPYELTHSNYKGYFYQSSYVDAIQLTANFTAQDTNDANYLLAVIHFLRSATKMFYGQDAERGSPPPVVYLSGFGDYQFREHSCLISNFAYNLPADVDYIRAGSPNNVGLNLTSIRDRQSVATNSIFGSINRLAAAFLTKGAVTNPPAPPTLGLNRPTYVPTKMEIQLTLLPIQSRNQVSNQFSLKGFANGDLLKGGFW